MVVLIFVVAAAASTPVTREVLWDTDWSFHRGDASGDSPAVCNATASFPINLNGLRCLGLHKADATSADECAQSCCAAGASCTTWQWCGSDASCAAEGGQNSCWIGAQNDCAASTGWISFARAAGPAPPSSPKCDSIFCKKTALPEAQQAGWHDVEVPHDWSILELPSREADHANFGIDKVLSARDGDWKFTWKDESSFAATDFDDSSWATVQAPSDWRSYSGGTNHSVGWFRRTVKLEDVNMTSLFLAMGTIVDGHTLYLNGKAVGNAPRLTASNARANATTDENGVSCEASLTYNRFAFGTDPDLRTPTVQIAIRVTSSYGSSRAGGLYDTGAPDTRVGAYDAGASEGQRQTGYSVGGVGWYRKNFSVLLDLAGNNTKTAASIASGAIRVILTFDGVYMDSTMWVNEIPLGNHPYGYTTFSYELPTSALSLEGENILAVKVDNRGSNSRWYSGSGIYRHVRLMLLNATVAIAREGVVVTTPSVSIADDARLAAEQSGVPAVTATSAAIAVTLTLEATPSAPVATVTVTLASATTPKTVIATQSIQVQQLHKERRVVTLTFKQSDVDLWSPISPNLYIATATVAGQDAVKVTFGVRDFSFDVNKGFVINAASMKLKGGCVHHDNGALGSAAIDAADRRRVKVLKDNGYNAIRTSHNPVSPAFLDACDELGVIVMDEAFDCWFDGKNSADYHVYFLDWWQRDVASMVKRDINHASVLMWSIGNEIPGRDSPEGYAYAQNISDYIRKLDKGGKRAVTSAYPGVNNKADPYFAALDVAGYNYGNSLYKSDHDRVPTRIMVGTESFPAATATVWSDVEADPWVIGDFIWTAIDYIGESSIGANGHNAGGSSEDFDACGGYCTQPYPYHVSFCGDIDLAGHRKPQSFLRAVMWRNSPLEMAVHAPVAPDEHEVVLSWGFADERQSWTWRTEDFTAARTTVAKSPLQVNVYARADVVATVGLTLNGKTIGEHVAVDAAQFRAQFTVPYVPGTLVATGYDASGNAIKDATKTFVSAGKPAAVLVEADRTSYYSDRNDLVFLTATAVDAKGVRVPWYSSSLYFPPFGIGNDVNGRHETTHELIAVGSGDPLDRSPTMMSHLSGSGTRNAFNGRVIGIYRLVRPLTGINEKFAGLTFNTTFTASSASGDLQGNAVTLDFVPKI